METSPAPRPAAPDGAALAHLNEAIARAMGAKDFAAARALLEAAAPAHAGNVAVWLNLAACCRSLGDVPAALAALDRALHIDAMSFRALLMKGALLEQAGERRKAALLYGAAAGHAPSEAILDGPTAKALHHARSAHSAYVDELARSIRRDLGDLGARARDDEARRVDEFIDLTIGRKRNFRQEPSEFFYPGLPAIPFWEREEFPWLGALEAAAPAIRDELLGVLRNDFRDFVPYLDVAEPSSGAAWTKLNRSTDWGALYLHHYGTRDDDHCRRCPQTAAALAAVPQPQIPRRSPTSLFSALQPGTHIPPHTGVTNTRLILHLPLIVPAGCRFRVGNEARSWREGVAWVFDDTLEHEAWNDSRHPRVILIAEVWNPRLSLAERELITAVMSAMDAFNGPPRQAGL